MARAGFVLRFLNRCALAGLMMVAAACGGGGDGAPPPPQPASLAITGVPVASMLPGESAQLTATLTYSDASTRDVTTTATWSTSNANVLAVASNGSIRAVAPGQVDVVASAEGLSSRATVSVAPAVPQPASLAIGGIPIESLTPGQSVQLTARLTYSDGSTADVTASTAWSSTDANVIAVSSSGALLAVAQGQAEVVADAQGLSSRSTVRVASPASRLAAFAGYLVEASFIDGPGAAARFKSPRGIATDGMGNIYIADSENHTIRKINSDGIVSTLAGLGGVSGSSDGTGTDARFYYPQGVALDSLGNVYVAESGNSTIRKITAAGVVSTIAGKPGSNGFADGVGTEARFSGPQGIAADAFGNLYVADGDNNAIRKITPAGVVSTLAGRAGSPGSADGVGADARFDWPVGIATDSAGNVYVADIDNSNIRKINAAGIVSTLAGLAGVSGSDDGIGADARFYRPWGIATDRAGILYVAEDGNNTIRKITPAGLVSTLAGEAGLAGSDDGSGAEARFETPRGVAADNAGNLYVADSGNDKIRKITPAVTVSTLAGKGKSGESRKGSADGIGEAAQFNSPGAVATDSLGNLYVADSGNNIVRKISPSAIVSTLAGKAGEYGSADGVGEAARFSRLAGIATDSLGNLYVADIDNNTVRKITPSGIVSTLAGQAGSRGSADGAGPDARFDRPSGIAVDSAGNVYVGDTYNFKIRKISPAGVVSTVAGSGEPGNRDGDGALASFGACSYVSIGPPYPPALMCSGFGLATDEAGNVYVADSGNHTIRKITPTGTVSTLAGKAGSSGSADGVGPEARFNDPGALALDSAGNVYVADNGNCTVCKLGRTGAVQTIVGVVGRCGFIGGSLPGGLAPGGVAISGSSLYATTHDGVAVATDRP